MIRRMLTKREDRIAAFLSLLVVLPWALRALGCVTGFDCD